MRKRKIILLLLLVSFFSCKKKDSDKYTVTFFNDGFESASIFEDLFPPDYSRWTDFNNVEQNGQNNLTIDTSVKHSGLNSLRCYGKTSVRYYTSKASIKKNYLNFHEGDKLYVSAWYYLKGSVNNTSRELYICDMEETTQTGASPGFRIKLSSDNANEQGALSVERGKISEHTIYQDSKVLFPHDQWVHFEMEALLSQKKKGSIKIWQDGVLLIDKNKIRLTGKDQYYAVHGTTGSIDKVEVGITANATSVEQTLYVDDVLIEKR